MKLICLRNLFLIKFYPTKKWCVCLYSSYSSHHHHHQHVLAELRGWPATGHQGGYQGRHCRPRRQHLGRLRGIQGRRANQSLKGKGVGEGRANPTQSVLIARKYSIIYDCPFKNKQSSWHKICLGVIDPMEQKKCTCLFGEMIPPPQWFYNINDFAVCTLFGFVPHCQWFRIVNGFALSMVPHCLMVPQCQ